jgi:hypothetical protein
MSCDLIVRHQDIVKLAIRIWASLERKLIHLFLKLITITKPLILEAAIGKTSETPAIFLVGYAFSAIQRIAATAYKWMEKKGLTNQTQKFTLLRVKSSFTVFKCFTDLPIRNQVEWTALG